VRSWRWWRWWRWYRIIKGPRRKLIQEREERGGRSNTPGTTQTYLREQLTVVVDIVVFGIICFIALYCDLQIFA